VAQLLSVVVVLLVVVPVAQLLVATHLPWY
jgi:hypothetical protein